VNTPTGRPESWSRIIRLAAPCILGLSLLLAGCAQTTSVSSGTITYNFSQDGDCYVVLDDDADVTNGYAKRLIISVSASDTSASYEMDTAAVAAGSYFLMGAYDFGAGMDPDDPSVWEALGWYESADENPPGSANVSNLSGVYDFSLTGLP